MADVQHIFLWSEEGEKNPGKKCLSWQIAGADCQWSKYRNSGTDTRKKGNTHSTKQSWRNGPVSGLRLSQMSFLPATSCSVAESSHQLSYALTHMIRIIAYHKQGAERSAPRQLKLQQNRWLKDSRVKSHDSQPHGILAWRKSISDQMCCGDSAPNQHIIHNKELLQHAGGFWSAKPRSPSGITDTESSSWLQQIFNPH